MSAESPKPLWPETPLIYSKHVSAALAADVYLKLDVLQPSQSFKYRGISHFIQNALRTHGFSVHVVIASGGNAGLAAACASKALNLRCTVFLPVGASASTLAFLKQEGAEIKVHGTCYQEALAAAEEAVAAEQNAVMVPAYNDPVVWEGHASMITEIARQLPPGTKPDAVVCSVGGGGLGNGVMLGCKAVGWDDALFIAMETNGANCFYQALALNPGPFGATPKPPPEGVEVLHDDEYDVNYARVSKLNSRASSSLGASWASPGAVKTALTRKGGVKSLCVSDEMAMQASFEFADDHKILVELACATTLVSAYSPALFDKLVPPKPSGARRTVVYIVCGGFKVSLAELAEYKTIVEADQSKEWQVLCNGEQWSIPK